MSSRRRADRGAPCRSETAGIAFASGRQHGRSPTRLDDEKTAAGLADHGRARADAGTDHHRHARIIAPAGCFLAAGPAPDQPVYILLDLVEVRIPNSAHAFPPWPEPLHAIRQ